VNEALRPIAIAEVTGLLRAGSPLTLDGSKSSAATGRTASFLWTVASVSGGAAAPGITNATQSIATVTAQAAGTVVLRLTVTDNFGASDAADVTVVITGTSGSTGSTSPPPTTGNGGGGVLSLPLLLGAAAMLALRRRARRRAA
jgi:serine protease